MLKGRILRNVGARAVEIISPRIAARLRGETPAAPAAQSSTTEIPVLDAAPAVAGQGGVLGRVIERAKDIFIGKSVELPAEFSNTFVVGLVRKALVAGVGAAINWLHATWGWDLVSWFGDGFEVGLINAIMVYLIWRVPFLKTRSK